jgi:RNA polymerase sigma factor, sigma-70 family
MERPIEDLAATFARLQRRLRSYLRRHVRDAAVAEDLLQEVFVKALASIRAKRVPKNLTGWLYAAARTTAVDYYRSVRPPNAELDDTMSNVETENEQLHQELATCLRPLAQLLPPIYRDTLLATDFEGESMQSLAAKHGLSVSAIKSRASRARAMLRDKLLECCHVEISNGTVTDYYRRSSSACGSNCA